jgi:pyruvate dehydrogenase E1 component
LYRDAIDTDRWNNLHADQKPRENYIQQCFNKDKEVFVAATDYLKALPLSVAKWFPGIFKVLGTDGFGRSDSRENLRNFFENDAWHIAWSALAALKEAGEFSDKQLKEARKKLNIQPDKVTPTIY